jgi:hypothetical protein
VPLGRVQRFDVDVDNLGRGPPTPCTSCKSPHKDRVWCPVENPCPCKTPNQVKHQCKTCNPRRQCACEPPLKKYSTFNSCPVENPCRNNCGTPDQPHGNCKKCNPRRPCQCHPPWIIYGQLRNCPRCNPCLKCGEEGRSANRCNSETCFPRCKHGNGRNCRPCRKEKKEKVALQEKAALQEEDEKEEEEDQDAV